MHRAVMWIADTGCIFFGFWMHVWFSFADSVTWVPQYTGWVFNSLQQDDMDLLKSAKLHRLQIRNMNGGS